MAELAALVHDVGHGPFSHVLDGIMEHRVGKGIHEKVSRAAITGPALADYFIDDDQAKAVADWVDPPLGLRSVGQDLVSGPTDADKLDYLLRDSHYCGVKYGFYDLERIVETAISLGGTEQSQLAFSQGGVDAIEGLLLARRSMFRQVYRQKTRLATDQMLIRSIEMAISEGEEVLDALIPEKVGDDLIINDDYLDKYFGQDDDSLRRLLEGLDGPPGELAQALRKRSLIHQVCQLDQNDIQYLKSEAFLARLVRPEVLTREKLAQVEAAIADDLGTEPHWVFVTIESEKNPLYRAPGWDQASSDIMIVRDHRDPEYFHQMSEIWGQPGALAWTFLSLYTNKVEEEKDKFRDFDQLGWQRYLMDKIVAVVEGS